MRRTRIKMMAAVMAATMLLGGCGDALYDLTDDEENVIVNYAAHIVTKYNTYQREGLTYVSPEEPEETQEDVTVPQTPETQDASETEQPHLRKLRHLLCRWRQPDRHLWINCSEPTAFR